MVTTARKGDCKKVCGPINRYGNVGHVNTPSDINKQHWPMYAHVIERNVQQMTKKRGGKRDKSRSAAARKLNLFLFPIDEFQLVKIHPHRWPSFVVL